MKYYTNNSYKQMQTCSGGQVTLDCPEKIYLDITQDCNLYCKMCRDGLDISGKTMPYNLFCRLVSETAPYVKSYSLFNWGEPLIVKDFRERVAYVNSLKRADCTVDISTNGMLLTDDMIGFLRSHEVIVTVSFDGADKETFEEIRCGANFERICSNLEKLSEAYLGVPPKKAPGIYTAIQRKNQEQLLAIAKLVHSLGIRRMGFGLVPTPIEYAPDTGEALRLEIEKTTAYIDSQEMLNDLYPTRIGDYLLWGGQYVPIEHFIVDYTCNAPLVNASIAYNGDVYLCCNVGGLVGNVSEKSFIEIWKSQAYDEFRESVNSVGAMPNKCKKCWWFNR